MSDISNLKDTIIPKSDQLNGEQLLSGAITVQVFAVSRGTPDQPLTINYAGDSGRPYKPCKTMRKVLIFAWGEDGAQWIGRSMTLFCDPSVKFGGVAVGGIRISHLSHIERDISLSLTATKGRKDQHTIKRLATKPEEPAIGPLVISEHRQRLADASKSGSESLKSAWLETPGKIRAAINGKDGCPADLKAVAAEADAMPAPETRPEVSVPDEEF